MILEDKWLPNIAASEEILWLNGEYGQSIGISEAVRAEDIAKAESLWQRFAPLLAECFPETAAQGGYIESPLREIPHMQQWLAEKGHPANGRLFLKMDSHLAIAGSVKARGGIFEVLQYTEKLALQQGLLAKDDDYRILLKRKDFFANYSIQVGSTGNLGLSIGLIAQALGYQAVVHMSSDAKAWKKALLRAHGVTVREYAGDYAQAVAAGRIAAKKDAHSHFVDDERSEALFLGYATAARRLAKQLDNKGIVISPAQPLVVYLPCGVGGAPGGITFGLKHIFGEAVHCFFVEPVACPCMLLGMTSGQYEKIAVTDIGLSGQTAADGLAVGRPSPLVSQMMRSRLSGIFSVKDETLFANLRGLADSEGIYLEPSACAGFAGAIRLPMEGTAYLASQGLDLQKAVQIVWATGGSMVPEDEMAHYLARGAQILQEQDSSRC